VAIARGLDSRRNSGNCGGGLDARNVILGIHLLRQKEAAGQCWTTKVSGIPLDEITLQFKKRTASIHQAVNLWYVFKRLAIGQCLVECPNIPRLPFKMAGDVGVFQVSLKDGIVADLAGIGIG
jgi:hypothetical protein